MKRPAFPTHAAAALFLERQHLTKPRGAKLTAARVVEFVAEVGGLQIDSINVLERAHYLTLWSRFGPYSREALDRLIYRRRLLFEYWAHAACFVPVADLPAWRRAMLDYRLRHTGWKALLRKHPKLIDATEEAIRERGPLGNSDFQQKRPGGAGWWSWKPVTHALHYLWMSGRSLIHSREHFQKRYDLAERLLPELASVEPLSAAEFARWHMRKSLHAMGAATAPDLNWYLTFPRTPATERRALLQRLLRQGEVVEIAIEGHRAPWYALREDLPALERAARRRAGTPPSQGTTLLAPFDSFLWHRERTRALFGFDYTIEVYVPGHKRVHGYYSLPILHQGRLIGRLDAKNHRALERLEVRRVHFEPWLAGGGAAPLARWGAVDRDEVLAGVAEALRSLGEFTGATRITLGRVTPARLKSPLAAALKRGTQARVSGSRSRGER
jgi:uncharacterized protein YcaQ